MGRFALLLATVALTIALAALWQSTESPRRAALLPPAPASPQGSRLTLPPPPRRETPAPEPEDLHHPRGEAFALLRRGHSRLEGGDWWGAVADLVPAQAALPERDDACVLLALAYHQVNLVNDVLPLLPCIERAARNGSATAASLLDEIDRRGDIEKEFRVVTSDHFVASHPSATVSSEDIGHVLDRLEDARASVEELLGFAADRLVPVVIYETNQFGDATKAPHWALGQYDGKIRLAAETLDWPPEKTRQILTHEYTHALVHELAGARVPAWLNEGLANNVVERRDDSFEMLGHLRSSPALLSTEDLSTTFSTLPRAEAEVAYQQAYWMTRNLIHEIGWGGVGDLLGTLQDRPQDSFADAFTHVTGESPEGYLDRWYDLVLAD